MDGQSSATRRADEIGARYGHLGGEALLRPLIEREFAGSIALVSSFGAEAALLLHMVATIDRATPVLFLDTQKHFGETLRYRDNLIARLGLTDVRSLTPDPDEVASQDPDGMLWHRAPDACCALRKVVPLERALRPFAAWITGRKRYQGGARAELAAIEAEGRAGQGQPSRHVRRLRYRGRVHGPRPAAPPVGRGWLPLDRLHALHRPPRPRLRPSLRPLGRDRKDRVWYSSVVEFLLSLSSVRLQWTSTCRSSRRVWAWACSSA